MTSAQFSVVGAFVDITPTIPVPLGGYVARIGKFQGIADRLEANIVLLRQGGMQAAFVSLDLLYVGSDLRSRIAAKLSGRLPPESLFLSASHTHFAPATDVLLPRLGQADPHFIEQVAERVADALLRLLSAQPVDATIRYASGEADHSVNRRLPHFGLARDFPFLKTRWEMRPNRAGPRDETIRLVSFFDPAGRRAAICWSYACHPVCFPQLLNVSADFPGVVRKALRAGFGDIPIVYWQGFSGDTRPNAIAPQSDPPRGSPSFAAFSLEQWDAWSGSLAQRVCAAAALPGTVVDGALSGRRHSMPLENLGPSAGGRALTAHEIRIGNELSIFGVSAEMVIGYVKPLQALRGCAVTIPVGCIDGVPGYVPTSEMVPQGGYEAATFMPLFGVRGRYREDVSQRVERELLAPRS